jgi:superfamily II DNA or RNA helicase
LLPLKARYRLALSATIERYRDPAGTEALHNYFGKTPCISFTLKEAIKKEFLTPYYYYPVMVYLNDWELEEYKELTQKIVKIAGFDAELRGDNSALDMLLIKRARIIAGCAEKVPALIDVISEFKDQYNMLVYCGATRYENSDCGDDEDIKQIDVVNEQLYKKLNMKVRKFTSSEGIDERNEIREMFINHEIQVITAIKCLDEGVNIPAIEKTFILASSTNPKEYIQRRGRVLRKAPNKDFAIIYDFITLPRKLSEVKYLSYEERKYDLSLVRREFARMIDFADTAQNPSVIDSLKREIENTYSVNELKVEGE